MRPEAAIFDLGGVVIDVSPGRAVKAWADAAGLSPDEARRRLMADTENYYRFERGEVGPEEFFGGVVRLLGKPLAPDAVRTGWLSLLGGPLPGIEPLLARLKKRLRLVLLTNTNAVHSAEFHRTCAPVLAHFERIFESWQMGCRKPEAACFRPVLEYLALPPDLVLYLDDTAENVEAAARMGMATRLVKGPPDIERELAAIGLGEPT